MPEKSVQVDVSAHGKVVSFSEVLGSTQVVAASLLIAVADEQVAIEHHHTGVQERLAARQADAGAAAEPDAGTGGHDQHGADRPPK